MTITATVADVIDETVYEGTTYQYRVVLERDGVTFGVFDLDKHASPDLVGERCEVEVVPFLVDEIERAEDATPGIEPNEDEPRGWKYHAYVGTVEAIDTDDPRTATLDLGDGTLEVELDVDRALVRSLSIGDVVRVRTVRTDLHGVAPL